MVYDVCAFSHNAGERPSEKELLKHICPQAIDKWKQVCTHLGIESPRVTGFERSHPNDTSQAFFQSLAFWLQGNAEGPITWKTLLEALEDAEKKQLAEDLKHKLFEGSL